MTRSFLALQGVASSFFGRLARGLVARGHSVRKVNFCGGDLVYSEGLAGWEFRGRAEELTEWYSDLLKRREFTDILMFGDCRSIHLPIHPLAQRHGIDVHVFEEGYVRPHWITLEKHGVNGRSLMPRNPEWYLEWRKSASLNAVARPTGYNLYERAFHDIRYRGANAVHARRFPNYVSHRPRNGFLEYAGLGRRLMLQRRHAQVAESITRELLEGRRQFYLFPMQLNSDAQISVHSPFSGVIEAIVQVLQSFARFAPSDSVLVIKNHPLDTGLIDYKAHALRLATELGVRDRMRFIDAGHLPTLLEHACGVVVVNSTVGLSALHHQRPLVALGHAIYDLSGLTWQGALDDFWLNATPPDPSLYGAFLDYVIHHTQINGDFYTGTGIEMTVSGVLDRLNPVVR